VEGRRLEGLELDLCGHVEHAFLDVTADQLAEHLLAFPLDGGGEELSGCHRGHGDPPRDDFTHGPACLVGAHERTEGPPAKDQERG
jgi:hypothetical protein